MDSSWIGHVINVIIVGLGAITLFWLTYVHIKVKSFAQKIENTMNAKVHGTGEINPAEFSFQQSENKAVEHEIVIDLMTEFDNICEPYQSWIQMIPIFPLLGLLGTVLGLVLQLTARDTSAIFDALGVSLYTTVFGLIAAIVSKFVDAFGPSLQITRAENALEKYERLFDDVYRKASLNKTKETTEE